VAARAGMPGAGRFRSLTANVHEVVADGGASLIGIGYRPLATPRRHAARSPASVSTVDLVYCAAQENVAIAGEVGENPFAPRLRPFIAFLAVCVARIPR